MARRVVPVFAFVMIVICFTVYLTTVSALMIKDTSDDGSNVVYNFTGTCAIKAWISVAGCRKDFIDRLVGKDEVGKCCLYRIMDSCAYTGAAKLCGNATDQVKEQYMKKYANMIGNPDCSEIQLKSWDCFWIRWENYVSSFIFFILVVIMITFVLRWYARQSLDDDPIYAKM